MVKFKYRRKVRCERKDGFDRLHDAMYDALIAKGRNRKFVVLKLRGYYRNRVSR